MKYTKDYFERYALLSLQECYDNKFSFQIFNKGESPDWYSLELSIGLEVTRAMSKSEGEDEFITNKYFGKGYGGNLIKKAAAKRFHKDLFKVIDNVAYTVWFGDFSKYHIEAKDALVKKTKKLNGNYNKFANNYLYIFINTGMFEADDIQRIIDMAQGELADCAVQFDQIFFNIMNAIFVYSPTEPIQKISIEDSVLAMLKKTAADDTIS
ncbi:MAG: hypothetical protein IKU32_04415 [Clostridia bacterium]|nr:hypothetical protein [Clostridia bacterium]